MYMRPSSSDSPRSCPPAASGRLMESLPCHWQLIYRLLGQAEIIDYLLQAQHLEIAELADRRDGLGPANR
jgi:hypothetical protein